MNVADPAAPGPAEGRLAENILHFARILRSAGMPVGPGAVLDAVRAVEVAGVRDHEAFYWALHSVFVKRTDQRVLFAEAFQLFFRVERRLEEVLEPSKITGEPEKPRAGARRLAEAMMGETLRRAIRAEVEPEREAAAISSPEEVFNRRDFAQMSADELAEARARIAMLRLPDDHVLTRRFSASPNAGRIDPRRTLRAALRTGGRMILPLHRRRKVVPPPVVAICDISGSMSPYSRIVLTFLHALSERRRVASFVFGTRLTNITRQLRLRDVDEALAAVSDAVSDWSGGTRIAAAIESFNRDWSRRVLGGQATVLLVTDGLERDMDANLSAAMDRLHRSCRRLIWLNPLLSYAGFQPRAQGIRAMLPHVDEMRPVHSLDSLEALCRALTDDAPPSRSPREWLDVA